MKGPGAFFAFTRFVFVGVFNTAASYVFFLTFLFMGLSEGPALACAFVLALALNYQTVRRLVFQSGNRRRFWPFVIVNLALFLLNLGVLMLVRRTAPATPAWMAQGLAAPVMALLSFYLQRTFVFNA